MGRASFGNFVVLVVDDDLDTLTTAACLIGDMLGCKVLTASSGDGALTIVEQHHVDLVFADIVMPKMHGLTLARIIQQRFPAMPVVLTTGLPGAVNMAEELGAVALIKPYEPELLVAIFGEFLTTSERRTA